MKFTPDDKLRLMRIVLAMEDLKDYIEDLTKATKSGPCRSLDGYNLRRLAALSIAHANFIDKEVVIPLPAKWTEANTKVLLVHIEDPGFMTHMVLSILTIHQGLHFRDQRNILHLCLALSWWNTTLACNCKPKEQVGGRG